MGNFSGILIAIILIIGIAVTTKPKYSDLKEHIDEKVVQFIKEEVVLNEDDEILDILTKFSCQLAPETRAQVALDELGFMIDKDDYVLFRKATIIVEKEEQLECLGFLNTWKCR